MIASLQWIFTMAWRDSRRQQRQLFLYASAIIIGIAATTAIQSFKENLNKDIGLQAKELLGADLLISHTQSLSDSLLQLFDTVAIDRSTEISFVSMAYFPKTNGMRLVQVRAVEGNFPFYGKITVSPDNISLSEQEAWLDPTLMLQFDIELGDTVEIGEKAFVVRGKLLEVPGQVTIFSAAAPAVFVPKKSIEATNLLKKGSRVNHRYYFKIAENTDLNAFVQKIKPFLAPQRINLETVASRQKQVSRAFDQLTNFLNIVGFTALLLGCLGVASAIRVYMRTKIPSVAVLRCLGVSAMKVMGIFLVQVIVVGFLSSLVGAILGSLIQKILPLVVGDFLPVEVSTDFSPYAFGQGMITGVLISVLFTLMPLLQLRDISPLAILRTDALSDNERSTLYRRMYSLALLLFVAIGTFFIELWQLKNVRQTALFTLVLLAVLSILVLAAHAIVRFVRYVLLKTPLNFLWRQGIASLQRPQNQTLLLIVSIGLGTALISTLFFTQEMLLARLRLSSQENLANFMCFDIQTEQKEAVKELLHNEGAIILQEVPVVSGRIESLNGITRQHLEKDSTSDIPKWVFNNELRFSYRDNLLESETTLRGVWEKGKNRQGDTLFISINKDFASMTKLSLGDNIVFNIHGVPFYTRVGHIREVDFSRLQSSFMMIFPEGVLEQAPQFHIVMARIKDKSTMARIQRLLFKTFPNVSVIDLETAINTLEKILNKVNFAIRFMAIFSIITGFFVLASTTAVSKVQRIKESVLLRTLGASQRQIFFINAIEYGVLGFLAAFTGVCLAIGISSLLASQTFGVTFLIDIVSPLFICLTISVFTLLIGLFNVREVISYPPITILREVE